jgi:hypothetical protein
MRAPGTRVARSDPRQRQLESLAAEFALLAQRRSRAIHQLALLDQQRAAALGNLHEVAARMAWLLDHIDGLDPELRGIETAADPEPQPRSPPPKFVARPYAKTGPVPAPAKPQPAPPIAARSIAVGSGSARFLAARPAGRQLAGVKKWRGGSSA